MELHNVHVCACSVSMAEAYKSCVNAINCTGRNTTNDLLRALGIADASMYLCSEELRQSENCFFSAFFI